MSFLKFLFLKSLSKKIAWTIFLSIVLVTGYLGINLRTFDLLTQQQVILNINIVELDEDVFLLKLTHNNQVKSFPIEGDQWQLDFRLIKFSPSFFLVFPESLFELQRLSNRFEDDDLQRSGPHYIYSLKSNWFTNKNTLWDFMKKYQSYLPFIEGLYGSSVYMPLSANVNYQVSISYGGLMVTAVDEETRQLIYQWQ